MRERGWEGLPPPPVFATGKLEPTGVSQKDPAATPVVTSLGLPNRDLEPQIPQPSPPEPVTVPELDPIPASPTTPVIQSPSISIVTLSDFTIADTSGDESHIDPAIADTSDDEPSIDPTAITPHETFYFEDRNIEVLCGNTLFRVHPSILSFHSPALRRMFAQTNLTAAESPNGCPRILSSDTPKDFATLLKMIYLPGYITLSACHYIHSPTTHLSTGSLNGIRSRISPHSHPSSESRQSTTCPPFGLSYSRSFATRTPRPSRGLHLPSRLERASSADRHLTQTRSSTSLSSRTSRPRCRWRTIWRLEGG